MESRINELIAKSGLSISAFAEKVGITQANMSNIVNGKSNPKMETLEKIAKALGVSVVELFSPVEKTDILGIIRVKDVYHEVKSIEEIEKLVQDYKEGKI